jgi:hypothetical protein
MITACFLISCQNDKRSERNSQAPSEPTRKHTPFTVDIGDFVIDSQIPAGWTTSKLSSDVFLIKGNCKKDKTFCNVAVLKITPNNNLKLKEVLYDVVTQMSSDYERIRIISIQYGVIAEDSVGIVDGMVVSNKLHVGKSVMVLMVNKKVVSLDYMASNEPEGEYAEERVIFRRIIETIKISRKPVAGIR